MGSITMTRVREWCQVFPWRSNIYTICITSIPCSNINVLLSLVWKLDQVIVAPVLSLQFDSLCMILGIIYHIYWQVSLNLCKLNLQATRVWNSPKYFGLNCSFSFNLNCSLDGLRSMGGHRFINWIACTLAF